MKDTALLIIDIQNDYFQVGKWSWTGPRKQRRKPLIC